ALHERWVKEGSVGTGIKEVGGTTLEILDPVRSAITVTLDVGEEFSIGLRFKTKPPTVELRVVTYLFRVTQEEAPIWYPPEVNGGVTYQIQARRP
ncbi:MAG: hypothetical protein GY835_24455, partial [bacterium]|nr:hypothetical protein [bacterium]